MAVRCAGTLGWGVRASRCAPSGTIAELRDLPVIMLSARAGEETRVEGLKVGADDYLVKPFASRELLARVEGNLKLRRLSMAPAGVFNHAVP